MAPGPTDVIAVRTASACSCGTNVTSLSRVSSVGSDSPITTRGSTMPTARASASLTPSAGTSALVCAVNRPMPARTRLWTTRPLGVVAATPCTGRKNNGWWQTTRSASICTASATTAGAGSIANSTRRTGCSGSPQTRPTASQSSAQDGGYHWFSKAVTSESRSVMARSLARWRSARGGLGDPLLHRFRDGVAQRSGEGRSQVVAVRPDNVRADDLGTDAIGTDPVQPVDVPCPCRSGTRQTRGSRGVAEVVDRERAVLHRRLRVRQAVHGSRGRSRHHAQHDDRTAVPLHLRDRPFGAGLPGAEIVALGRT